MIINRGKKLTKPLIRWFARGSLLMLLLNLAACQIQVPSPGRSQQQSTAKEQSRLTLNNATLEQSNAKGETLWKIQVDKAVYSPDRQKAQLSKIRGGIFQGDKLVLQISADRGQIVRDGEDIFLENNVIATDPRNGAVISSQQVEWQPRHNLLMVRKNLKGTHAQLQASATEGRYNAQQQRLELIGKIVATAKNPRLQLKTEHLLWDIPRQKVTGDRLLTIIRYQDKTITDRLVTKRSQVNLKTKQIFIQENIEFKSLAPPLQIATNSVMWNYQDRIIQSKQPVKLFDYQNGITITGNQALVNLNKKVAQLKGGVEGTSSYNQGKLYANQLTWNITTQIVEAVGNVIYEQNQPQFNLSGERATGRLQDNSLVVSGNSRQRVVTEIFPE